MGAESLASWLREKRAALRAAGRIATQEEISKRATRTGTRVSRSMISMLESMDNPSAQQFQPSREVVRALALALEASPAEALIIAGYVPGEEDLPRVDSLRSDVAALATKLQQMPPDVVQMIAGLVERLERGPAPSDEDEPGPGGGGGLDPHAEGEGAPPRLPGWMASLARPTYARRAIPA